MSDWNFEGLKITDDDYTGNDISGLANKPSLSAAALKTRFDANVKNIVKPKHNDLCDRLDSFAESVAYDIQYTQEQIVNFVADMLFAWRGTGAVYSYVSADAPTFTMRSTGNTTIAHPPGTKIKLQQGEVTKYFIVTASSYDSGTTYTTITLYGGTDYTLADETISNVGYSYSKAPDGFPLDPAKWTETLTSSASQAIEPPTQNVVYNISSLNVPIGVWRLSLCCEINPFSGAVSEINQITGLSTTNNTFSDTALASRCYFPVSEFVVPVCLSKNITLASKTAYYLNLSTTLASMGKISVRGDFSPTIIRAECAYL